MEPQISRDPLIKNENFRYLIGSYWKDYDASIKCQKSNILW